MSGRQYLFVCVKRMFLWFLITYERIFLSYKLKNFFALFYNMHTMYHTNGHSIDFITLRSRIRYLVKFVNLCRIRTEPHLSLSPVSSFVYPHLEPSSPPFSLIISPIFYIYSPFLHFTINTRTTIIKSRCYMLT